MPRFRTGASEAETIAGMGGPDTLAVLITGEHVIHGMWHRYEPRQNSSVCAPVPAVLRRIASLACVEHRWMVDLQPSATDLLLRAGSGERAAVESMFPLVYDELRRLAHRHLARESTGRTLATTELVHEAYLRLIDQTRVQWTGHAHFMAIAATAMRRILVDRARSRRSLKRGGPLAPISLDLVDLAIEERADLLVALDEALDRLRELDERQARVVECRFFGGMTEEETAEAIGIALRTAKRDWAKAKSWLYRELFESGAEPT